MTQPTSYSFDLAEEMVQQLHKEFGPEALVKEIEQAFAGAPDAATADRFFADFGSRWMDRSIELGEKHPDRTFEVLQETAKRIPSLAFPFFAQRYIELAYLSTQPIYTVPIVENGATGLAFKMPFCGYYTAIEESKGEKFASQLHCKSTCMTACQKAFEHFGQDVSIGMSSTMPEDGLCQFTIRRA